MATKQELEAELEKAKKAPALTEDEKKNLATADTTARLAKLEAELKAAKTELVSQAAKAQKEKDSLQKQVADLQAQADSVEVGTGVAPPGYASLDGEILKVTYRGGLRDLLEDYKRRNVDEEHLALLVDKKV